MAIRRCRDRQRRTRRSHRGRAPHPQPSTLRRSGCPPERVRESNHSRGCLVSSIPTWIGGDMRVQARSLAAAGLTAAVFATAAFAPPPQEPAPRPVAQEVRLSAAPALGAIPLAFVRNQFEYCSLICPYAIQGLATVPLALVQLPATFVGSLATTGSLLRAIGSA